MRGRDSCEESKRLNSSLDLFLVQCILIFKFSLEASYESTLETKEHFLNPVIDHVISIDRSDVVVYKGNSDTWQEQKERQDQSELAEKEQLKKDINRLHETAVKRENWSRQTESQKNRKHKP